MQVSTNAGFRDVPLLDAAPTGQPDHLSAQRTDHRSFVLEAHVIDDHAVLFEHDFPLDPLLANVDPEVFPHAVAATPSVCAYKVLDYAGTVLEQGTAAGGVFTPGAGVVSQARQDCAVEWTYTVDGAQKRTVEQFDVVLWKLYPVATEADLIREAPALVASEKVHRGTVYASDANGLTDKALIGTREDWEGAVLAILSGSDLDGRYVVTAFDPVTGTLTYTHTKNPAPGTTYTLRRSYQPEMDAAWEDLYDRLIQACASSPGGQGYQEARPFLIMTPDRLRRPHLLLALAKAFRGVATDTSGPDWARAEYYQGEFETAMAGLKLVFAEEGNTPNPVADDDTTPQWGFSR